MIPAPPATGKTFASLRTAGEWISYGAMMGLLGMAAYSFTILLLRLKQIRQRENFLSGN
jgi:hypothetical protein